MDLGQFSSQLGLCGQSPDEIRTFVQDFAQVRLAHVIRLLNELEVSGPVEETTGPKPHLDWDSPDALGRSGISPEWIVGQNVPESIYLHSDLALHGDWKVIAHYLAASFMSDKQARLLFPILAKTKRPQRGLDRAALEEEVGRLNSLLRWSVESGMDWLVFRRYQAHLKIHGASQNVSGVVGSAGAAIAIMDALKEIDPDGVVDILGTVFPENARTPSEVYAYFYGSPPRYGIRALLLRNGRAVVFASDPDVAIIQSLGPRYESAAEAFAAWEKVRRDISERIDQIHLFAVGEVKTATDAQNLHERLALGSRETRDEVRTSRFLLMAILTDDLLKGTGGARRRSGSGLANRDVERFSDVFNLYFAWGYDGARRRHSEHWKVFKERLAKWCFNR